MNGFTMGAVLGIMIFGMITIVSCRVSGNHARVKIAEARASRTVMHVSADTGEVHQVTDPDTDVENMGVNQTGSWAKDTVKAA